MRAKKHLGQHFLKDGPIIHRILECLEAKEGEGFLEIGPGPATLTMPFSHLGFPLTVVEADLDMVSYLQGLDWPTVPQIIHADVMDVDLNHLIKEETKVFSNLPYNVSVPITAALLRFAGQIPLMVMMYQKEVAERIRAQSGSKTYGPISVLVDLYYQCDLHFNVKPGSFRPPPKVMSQVIRLRRRDEPLLQIDYLAEFERLVRFLFQSRRKMIGTLLRKWSDKHLTPEILLESMTALGLDPQLRPERLSPQEYVAWFLKAKGVT